ncbi:uncharacterized protein CLUP02_02367 [Colletotrichum lupini]|uniref:Uncharacterized protein n=1 Tax=Colletotrichum lupini TaxID=145971 RepID=A0A9Q8SHB0_9PEZI|nr:uncharacterized protein CLUP02_02367 [Colletotrichum lupini]UQC76901.1 hypothetical protein CLUP02_02367 [Colletotrichum lupini]
MLRVWSDNSIARGAATQDIEAPNELPALLKHQASLRTALPRRNQQETSARINVFNPRISAFSQILGRPDDGRAYITKSAINPSERAFLSHTSATTASHDAALSQPSASYNSGQRHNITTGRTRISCGNTTKEARAKGCKYDVLLNHWVPAQCFDKDSVDEYQEDASWGAFADKNMTQQLTIDEMSERDFYWTSIRDHINHCAIMWRRQFYALYDERAAIDTIYLMDAVDSKWKEPTKTMRGFAGCWARVTAWV